MRELKMLFGEVHGEHASFDAYIQTDLHFFSTSASTDAERREIVAKWIDRMLQGKHPYLDEPFLWSEDAQNPLMVQGEIGAGEEKVLRIAPAVGAPFMPLEMRIVASTEAGGIAALPVMAKHDGIDQFLAEISSSAFREWRPVGWPTLTADGPADLCFRLPLDWAHGMVTVNVQVRGDYHAWRGPCGG